MGYKLTFELVPDGCWGSNLRNILTASEWNLIKKISKQNANGKCSICGNLSGELHTYEDGVCTLCEYEHETHKLLYQKVSDQKHTATCTTCGHETTESHDITGEYQCDAKGHWVICKCGHQSQVIDHFYTATQGVSNNTCMVCGYVKLG